MEQEIKDIIAKNLPEQVGSVLKEKLEKAEKDAYMLRVVTNDYELKCAEVTSLRRDLEDAKSRINEEISLESWKQTLKDKEKNLELEILKIRLEEAEKRNSIGERLVEQVFRSPVYRKYVESREHGSYDAAGRYSVTHSTPISETTSID
jgi:hypothetical protein